MTAALVFFAALVPGLMMWSVAPPERRRARSWWVAALLLAGAAWVAVLEPWLAVAAVALLVWWVREPEEFIGRLGGADLLPVICSWLAIAGTWFLVRAIPEAEAWWILVAWGLIGWAQSGLMLWQRIWGTDRRAPHGGFGQRMYAGCALAVLCALLPIWVWPGLLVGLWLSGPSWLAVAALVAGSAVRWPWAIPWVGIVVLVAILALLVERRVKVARARDGRDGFYPFERWTPRGDAVKTVRMRARIVRVALRDLARSPRAWLIGFGPGTAPRASRRWNLRVPKLEALGSFHCEPLQVAYEFGALGVLGLVLFGWRVGSGLAWGDPWSAAVVAGFVVAAGSNASGIIPVGVMLLVIWARAAP